MIGLGFGCSIDDGDAGLRSLPVDERGDDDDDGHGDGDGDGDGEIPQTEPPPNGCSIRYGDTEFCPGCEIESDIEWSCEGKLGVSQSWLEMNNKRVYGDYFYQGLVGHSIIFEGNQLFFREPLEDRTIEPDSDIHGIASVAPDGKVYRYYDALAYLYTSGTEWTEVPLPPLPEYNSEYGFRVRPAADGTLHAVFQHGDLESGSYYFATRAGDLSWSWTGIASYDPNVFGDYVGKDAWDRTYALINTGDWDGGDQTLLKFLGGGYHPVGSSGELGRVAEPPRPTLAPDPFADPPIATLRRGANNLEFLTITNDLDWDEAAVPGTEFVPETCRERYNEFDKEAGCTTPCHSEGRGIEFGAHDLARTTDGALWATWFVVDATIDVSYTPIDQGSYLRCNGDVNASAFGQLHLAELDPDGSIGRHLVIEFDDVGTFRYPRLQRELAIAAWEQQVAVMLPLHQRAESEVGQPDLTMRLLVFNTDEID